MDDMLPAASIPHPLLGPRPPPPPASEPLLSARPVHQHAPTPGRQLDGHLLSLTRQYGDLGSALSRPS